MGRWLISNDKPLTELWLTTQAKVLAKRFGCSMNTVSLRAKHLGLPKKASGPGKKMQAFVKPERRYGVSDYRLTVGSNQLLAALQKEHA